MKTINITLTNRMLVSLFIIITISILTIGVYAYTNPIPDPGHGGENVTLSINGVETDLASALNQEKSQISLVCVTAQITEGSSPIFIGSSDGNAYSVAEVVEATGNTRLRCKDEDNWIMTGCSDKNNGYYQTETLWINECIGAYLSGSPDILTVRCCKIVS